MPNPTRTADGKPPDGGDIVTAAEYGDFELQLDWKIGACGNSGVIYHIRGRPR